MLLLSSSSSSSPLGVSDSLGEHIVLAVQVHDAVLQVELPLVLASVDLGTEGGGEEACGGLEVHDTHPSPPLPETLQNVC